MLRLRLFLDDDASGLSHDLESYSCMKSSSLDMHDASTAYIFT